MYTATCRRSAGKAICVIPEVQPFLNIKEALVGWAITSARRESASRDQIREARKWPPTRNFQQAIKKCDGRTPIRITDIDYREGQTEVGWLLVIEYADKATAVAAMDEYYRDVTPLNTNKPRRELFIVEGLE